MSHRLRLLPMVLAGVAALVMAAPALAHRVPPSKPVSKMTLKEKERYQVRALAHHEGAVRCWQNRAKPSSRCYGARHLSADTMPSEIAWHAKAAKWTARELAETRAAMVALERARRYSLGPAEVARAGVPGWFLDGILCIHKYEGAWNANTGNGYYGGVQMDITFQRTHGMWAYRRWGTANNWPVWAQIKVAYTGYLNQGGWAPWPNTSRMCGLR